MELEKAIIDIVNEVLDERLDGHSPDPVMISPDEAMKIMWGNDGQDHKSAFWAIANDTRNNNGFPIVALGKRTHLVDKHRLTAWLARGGLGVNV